MSCVDDVRRPMSCSGHWNETKVFPGATLAETIPVRVVVGKNSKNAAEEANRNSCQMKRHQFIITTSLAAAGAWLPIIGRFCHQTNRKPPNIIFIVADDLGYGELGCYGHQRIRRPNIDRLASEGRRFAQHYSGRPIGAPSRCAVMTGQHTGLTYIGGNDEMN